MSHIDGEGAIPSMPIQVDLESAPSLLLNRPQKKDDVDKIILRVTLGPLLTSNPAHRGPVSGGKIAIEFDIFL